MELITILFAVTTLIVLYYWQKILQVWRFLKKAAKLPTNRPNPIFGHMFDFLVPRNQLLSRFLDLPKKNEPLFTVWLGPVPLLCVVQPKHMEILLGSSKYIYKEFPYTFLKPWLGDGLLNSTGEKWHARRKMLTPAFHFTILENFVEVFSEKSKILVKLLQKESGAEEFDIFPYINLCALDIICETAMGTDMKAQEQGEHSAYVKAVNNISHEVMQRILSPWLHPEFIFKLSPSARRSKKYLKVLHDFSNTVIRERRQAFQLEKAKKTLTKEDDIGKKKRLTFLDLLLDCMDEGKGLTDEDIREEVDTFMFEGHDTTTMGISWTLQLLALHPEVQEKVFEELEDILQGSDRSPTIKELNEMKYLERVIKESLRLYPSVPIFVRALLEDTEIDGMSLPAGLRICALAVLTHRDPEHFPDPDIFDPDRFLPENIASRHPYAYIPFSAGPRNCIGQKFALLEEKMMISHVLLNFKLEATRSIPVGLPDIVLRPENGVHMKISPRRKT